MQSKTDVLVVVAVAAWDVAGGSNWCRVEALALQIALVDDPPPIVAVDQESPECIFEDVLVDVVPEAGCQDQARVAASSGD